MTRTDYLAKPESPAQIALLLAALPACFVAGGLCMLAVAALTQFRDPFDGDKFVVAGAAALLIGTTLLAAVASYMAGQFSRTGGTMIEATAFAAPAPAAPDVFDRAASVARTAYRTACRLSAAALDGVEAGVIAVLDWFNTVDPAAAMAAACRSCDRAYQSALDRTAAVLTGPTSQAAGRVAFPIVSAAMRHGPAACVWFAAWAASVAAVLAAVATVALIASQLPALSVPGPESPLWSLLAAAGIVGVACFVGSVVESRQATPEQPAPEPDRAAWELGQAVLDSLLTPAVVMVEPSSEVVVAITTADVN